jgi:hypothetical protein
MTPLVTALFGGATLTEHDDLAPGKALLGLPVWGPSALLANLELRLGLPSPQVNEAVRVQRWSRRLAARVVPRSQPGRSSRDTASDEARRSGVSSEGTRRSVSQGATRRRPAS